MGHILRKLLEGNVSVIWFQPTSGHSAKLTLGNVLLKHPCMGGSLTMEDLLVAQLHFGVGSCPSVDLYIGSPLRARHTSFSYLL